MNSPQEVLERYEQQVNQHDFDLLEPLLSADCTFWFSSGTYVGIEEARAAFEKTWGLIESEVYSLSDLQWIATADAAAVCTYTFHWSGRIDGERREGRGRGTTCFRREQSGWKIIHEHLSPFPKP